MRRLFYLFNFGFFILVIFGFCSIVYGQDVEVTTLAGHAANYESTNGKGIHAAFFNPAGVAVDSSGNVYVADTQNNLIRKITSGGLVSTLAGQAGVEGSDNGTGTAASFFHPSGVAVDSSGNVYVADVGNELIRKITSRGVVSTLAGQAGVTGSTNGTGTDASFLYPSGIAVDTSGNVYVAERNNLIRKITSGGVVSTLAGQAGVYGYTNGAGTAALFNCPEGVAVDSSGNVYVADTFNSLIRKITSGGVVSTLVDLPGIEGSDNSTAASFNLPTGVTVDSSGNVYVADTQNNLIRKITSGGVVSTLAGQAGVYGHANGVGNTASFHNPEGVAVDFSGNVYVADCWNDLIRKIRQ